MVNLTMFFSKIADETSYSNNISNSYLEKAHSVHIVLMVLNLAISI